MTGICLFGPLRIVCLCCVSVCVCVYVRLEWAYTPAHACVYFLFQIHATGVALFSPQEPERGKEPEEGRGRERGGRLWEERGA